MNTKKKSLRKCELSLCLILSSNTSLVALTPSADEDTSVVIPVSDLNLFLAEQVRGIKEVFSGMDKMFPESGLVAATDAKIMVVLKALQRVIQNYVDGLDYVEDMLRKQLIAAIGKEVTPLDFAEYMVYHNRKIFKEEYQPRPFSYAIRKPDHFPEGTIGIDVKAGNSVSKPINTLVRHSQAVRPMRFPINASTHVAFKGDRYLHAYISHQFSKDSGTGSLSLVARARQFSSFILLIGTIAGAELFDPKYAIIVKNKDDLLIPLLLETVHIFFSIFWPIQIPTAKAFRDAIESLSPEQQRFAQAFRSMQLASTVFGVAVLQIKPQLEKLLKLPADSLIKEIKLSEDLLELFLKYQIPSDLLSYDGMQAGSSFDFLR